MPKSYNIQQRQWAVEQAWREMFPPPPPVYSEPAANNDPWIVEILDDAVIIFQNEKYYRAKYTVKGDSVEIAPRSEWAEVESKHEWVAAAKAHKSSSRVFDETLIAMGGAIKALGNGKFGGHLVTFTKQDDPDLEDDFFDKKTDFDRDFPTKQTVYFHHGLDPRLGIRKLSKANLELDDVGVWMDWIMEERDEYEKFLIEMGMAGKLGLSSGAPSHLVRRTQIGKSNHIDYWPIADASITHIPAEPRNQIISLKSWKPSDISSLMTLAERISSYSGDMNSLTSDLRAFVKSIDRPLSETKRKELTELLESCSGLDAVRSDLQSVLSSAPKPVRLVEPKLVSHQLAEARKRLSEKHILQE